MADISGKEIIEIIKEAGIVGMGGAGFPTHVKYMPKDPSAIDHIIVNCAECEPYLTSDYRRMMEEPEKIVGGLQAAMKIFDGRAKGVLAVEDNRIKNQVSAGSRATAYFCSHRKTDQFFHASGRCRMCSQQL